MAMTLKKPAYFNEFRCIGKECEMDCCGEWGIVWYNNEVEKLKSAKCSPALKQLAKSSFKAFGNEELRSVIFDAEQDCPFHDKNDRLCMIQKELGEEYLSHTCRSYPTAGTINNNVVCQFKLLSCPAVYDLVTQSFGACDIYVSHDKPAEGMYKSFLVDTKNDIVSNPLLTYRNQLFDFFYSILSNKKTDVKTSVVLGILAASKLNEFAKKDVSRIPEVIKALTPQMTNPATVKSIDEINPNYAIKLPIVQSLLSHIALDEKLSGVLADLKAFGRDGSILITPEQYGQYVKKFEKCFPKDFVIKNVIRSLYLDLGMPFVNKTGDIFENYVFFAAIAASVEFLGARTAATYDSEEEIRAAFKKAICTMSKTACHSQTAKDHIVQLIKDTNCYTTGCMSITVK